MAVFSNNVSMQDVDAPPIAVLYITHMKTTSACSPELRSSTHPTVLIDNRDVGTPALEIRLYPWVSILEPLCLVVFGTDPEQCTIVLADTEGISPVHCKLHLQLNTEGNVWLVEDCSGQNTAYCDDEGLISNTHQVVSSGRRASVGIHSIGIGPYVFCCQLPNSDAETAKLREFRRRNEPIPVTGEILDKQLNGVSPRFYHMQLLGSGGFGKVFKAMEKHTGLVIAIKQQTVKDDKRVQREMGSMKELSHCALVPFIFAHSDTKKGYSTWLIGMPLFQGTLREALPIDKIDLAERAMIQLVDALTYVHGKGFLHRDIKPDNIFIASKNPLNVVLGDLGFATAASNPKTKCGSNGYYAPEMIKGAQQTPAVDVYSLGITFWEMIADIRDHHLSLPARVLNIVGQPPPYYSQLIEKMTAHNPLSRARLPECLYALKMKHRFGTPIQKDVGNKMKDNLQHQASSKLRLKGCHQPCRPQTYLVPRGNNTAPMPKIRRGKPNRVSIFMDSPPSSDAALVPKFDFIRKADLSPKPRIPLNSLCVQPSRPPAAQRSPPSHKVLIPMEASKTYKHLNQAVDYRRVTRRNQRNQRNHKTKSSVRRRSLVVKCAWLYNTIKHVPRKIWTVGRGMMGFLRDVKLTAKQLEYVSRHRVSGSVLGERQDAGQLLDL